MMNNRFNSVLILSFSLALSACVNAENKTSSTAQPISVAQSIPQVSPKKSSLDYYVVALSWSPEYCKMHKQVGMQCKRQPPYRFVLHGLWPSINKTCTKEKLTNNLINTMLPIMPSKKLIEHEWKKHGRCSGFTPKQFFGLAKQAFEEVKIPDFFNSINTKATKKVKEIKALFLAKNSDLKGDSLRVVNVNRELSEIRVCLDKSLQAINCPFPAKSNPNTEITIVPPTS